MRGPTVRRSVIILFFAIFVFVDPVMARLSLLGSFSVAQSHTSNLLFEEDNEEADWATFIGPNLTLLFENQDLVLGATYFGRVALFFNNPDENRYIQNANIILDLPFLTKRYRGLTVRINERMVFTPQIDAFSLSGAEDFRTQGRGGGFGGTGGLGGGGNTSGGSSGGGNTGGGSSGGGSGGGSSGGGNVIGGVGDVGGIGGAGVFNRRANSFTNNAGITFGYAWTPGIQSSLGYQNRYLKFFSGGFQDSITHVVPTSLSFRLTDQTSVTPFYSYRQTNFIGSSSNDTSGDKIISHNPSLGISHSFTQTLLASIRGGVAFTKQIGATQEVEGPGGTTVTEELSEKWRTNFIGSASLSKRYTQGLITVTFAQTIGDGAGLAAQTTVTRRATGRIRHDLSRRLYGFARVGWANNDSIDGDALDVTTYRIQTGFGYSFTSWLFGNFAYSHINQSSSGSAANDLNVDQFYVGLTAVANPWFISR